MKKTLIILSASAFLAACQANETNKNEKTTFSSEAVSSSEVVESTSEVSTSESIFEEEAVTYKYQINPDIFTVQPITDADTEVILLTFDDAPQPPDSHTLEIAQTVKEKGAHAIFFVMGQFLESDESRAIIKEVSDMGFEIGNHSYSHPDMSSISYEEQLEEIVATNDAIEEITGKRARFFRAPYGSYNADTDTISTLENMTLMNWTYGYDWVDGYMEETALADIMVNAPELGSGGNLLMHDRPWTAAAIGTIIDGLRAKGYEMVDPKLIESPEEE